MFMNSFKTLVDLLEFASVKREGVAGLHPSTLQPRRDICKNSAGFSSALNNVTVQKFSILNLKLHVSTLVNIIL